MPIVKFHSRSLTFVLSSMGDFYNVHLMSEINIFKTESRYIDIGLSALKRFAKFGWQTREIALLCAMSWKSLEQKVLGKARKEISSSK